MHSTPSGTPLASPREGNTPQAGSGTRDNDLEAPLLPRRAAKHGGGAGLGRSSSSSSMLQAVVFGLINAAAGVPALIAFCAVVFKDEMYLPYLDQLCKFFYLASAVHQGIVTLLSSLPYAVGQVQDVGLIFLSAMASSIASLCSRAGLDASAALGTSLLTMAASSAIVGLGLLAVAKARLASAVQYLPLPAVGGYLSYVGYFCIASGLGLGCGIQLGPLASWAQLWDPQVALRVLPTLGSTALLMLTMARCKHPLALPGVLAAIVGAFHLALLAAGMSLQDAQDAGWVLKPAASTGPFWSLWGLFDMPGGSLARLHLGAALQQVGKLLGLFLLVCFGSCMDIAAIQQDSPQRLDTNRELACIGLSNVAVGLIGTGFTGSFIFSQTIFTGRAGVHSRINGAVIALCELALFAVPFSIVQYAPTFFFGALLVWFGVEICLDWVLRSYSKLTGTEYALLWATFAAIMQWGLEAGIAAGVVAATLYFALGYAQSQLSAFTLAPGRSRIVRAADQEAALELLRPAHLVSAQLRGFLFFGVANAISVRVHEAAQCLASGLSGEACGVGGSPVAGGGSWAGVRPQQARQADRLYAGSSKHDGALFASAAAPRFLLLDLSSVKGIDATAARTLASLLRDLGQLDIAPVVTGATHRPSIRPLLLAHGAPLPPEPAPSADAASPFLLHSTAVAAAADLAGPQQHCHEFASYEEGLRFCESQLLAVAGRYGLCRPPSAAMPLEDLLRSHASQAGLPFVSKEDSGAAAAEIARYCMKQRYRPGDVLWREGAPSDELFMVEQGRVTVQQRVQQPGSGSLPEAAGSSEEEEAGVLEQQQQQGAASPAAQQQQQAGVVRVRLFEFGPGCIAGAVDFYLRRTRSSTATVSNAGVGAGSASCHVLRITREALGRMAVEAPGALHVLQAVVLRAKCLDLGTAAELAVATAS
ncbi:sulfate transporter [Chlorella sorokiniana]|uniref:Sulfate transporter n=1 Tax=Chlorella sorokiniana TaxID=3076 RepID=A0A2P6TXS4_CHLSO|nr:sulfate transporter [Chlorella sorokiniana]|eukprot:PRW58874.1 sulfate transporter [Chlorella sorokiniana]